MQVKDLIKLLQDMPEDAVVMRPHGLRHISPISVPEIVSVTPSKECNPTYYGEFEEMTIPNDNHQKVVKL